MADFRLPPLDWLQGGADRDVVVYLRLQYARNLRDALFPWKASPSELLDIRQRIAPILDSQLPQAFRYNFEELDTAASEALTERYFLGPLQSYDPSRSLFVTKEGAVFSINDTDHLRFSIFSSGSDFSKPLETLRIWDEKLDALLDWACTPDLGFLTTRVEEVGSALSCGALIFIPGIVYSSMFERLSQRLLSQGIRVRFYASGGEEDGEAPAAPPNPLVEISAPGSLGTDENTFIGGFRSLLMELVEGERKTRERIKVDRAAELENEAFRSAALLRASKILDFPETRRLLVALRSGLVYGLAPKVETDDSPDGAFAGELCSSESDPFGALDRLYVDVGESQVRFSGVSGKDENKMRAELVRRELPRYLI